MRSGPEGQAALNRAMADLRATPPSHIGGCDVHATTDLWAGTRTSPAGTEAVELPRSNVLAFELAGGHRALVRPSGTEPKLKVYVEAKIATGDLVRDRAEAERVARAIEEDLLGRVG